MYVVILGVIHRDSLSKDMRRLKGNAEQTEVKELSESEVDYDEVKVDKLSSPLRSLRQQVTSSLITSRLR